MDGIYRTIKAVETVTSELKSKPKKSQDFQPQNDGRTQVKLSFSAPGKRQSIDCLFALIVLRSEDRLPNSPFSDWERVKIYVHSISDNFTIFVETYYHREAIIIITAVINNGL